MPEKRKPGTEGGRKFGCSIKNARRIPPAPPPSSRYSDSPTDDASPPPRCTRSIPCRPIVFPDGISVPGEMGEYIVTFFPLQRGSVSFQISSHGERVWSGISQVGGGSVLSSSSIFSVFFQRRISSPILLLLSREKRECQNPQGLRFQRK